jgi:hypothetical protein
MAGVSRTMRISRTVRISNIMRIDSMKTIPKGPLGILSMTVP